MIIWSGGMGCTTKALIGHKSILSLMNVRRIGRFEVSSLFTRDVGIQEINQRSRSIQKIGRD